MKKTDVLNKNIKPQEEETKKQEEDNSFKGFWKKVWDYIKKNWIHWLTLGLTFIISKLKDLDKEKPKEDNKEKNDNKK